MPVISIVKPYSSDSSTCGYCSPPGQRSETASSYTKASLTATQLSCTVYQKMIDRGWRRSGQYCYAPNLRKSCCPAYTIKLDALEFKPSRSHRKVVNRWNRFVISGADDENGKDEDMVNGDKRDTEQKPQKAVPKLPLFTLGTAIHASEYVNVSDQSPAHRFEVNLEPPSFSDEKFSLYEKYQRCVHGEEPRGFRTFLVTSLINEDISYRSNAPSHLPLQYGSYHQTYRLDGELIALGVIDILPSCVSSVYFMYDPKWEKYSFGKLSALQEASLAREIHEAGAKDMNSLYMGFYIHSCQKSRYKGDYSPSYLADPEKFTWYPLKTCRQLLDQYRYVSFAHPEHSIKAADELGEGEEVSYECLNFMLKDLLELEDPVSDEELDVEVVKNIYGDQVVPTRFKMSKYWTNPETRNDIACCVRALGSELASEMVFHV